MLEVNGSYVGSPAVLAQSRGARGALRNVNISEFLNPRRRAVFAAMLLLEIPTALALDCKTRGARGVAVMAATMLLSPHAPCRCDNNEFF